MPGKCDRCGAYLEDGKGLSIQDVMPKGVMGPVSEEPVPENLKLVGIDFYHRYEEDIRLFYNVLGEDGELLGERFSVLARLLREMGY